MIQSNRCLLHDAIVAGLMTSHYDTIGRDIVSLFHLPGGSAASIAMISEPKLVCRDRGVMANGYPDILAVIRSGGALFTSLIEVKRTPRDLLTSGRQYAKYLGCSSAFFISVPSSLLHIAVSEIRYPLGVMTYKGVVNADNGEIVVLPTVQDYDIKANLSLLSSVTTFKTISNTGRCGDFENIDNMMVRKTYAPIVERECAQRYPRDTYYDMYAKWH